ncbi:MCR_0457 family protein [Alkanindiges sp. WGS2144]|uniref:MCR_0457 family protein n=1 Tax=Alkanindiges sp. WGS2144 TaxID=3366808 RepID=UPI0037518DF4
MSKKLSPVSSLTKKIGLNLSLVCLIAGSGSLSLANAAAASKDTDNRVEFKSSLPVTQEEIAVVDVLGEICPKILGKNTNFDAGYKKLLADLLPTIEQPVLALQALQEDAEYQKILQQAHDNANRATVQENREVCLDIVHYQANSKKSKK